MQLSKIKIQNYRLLIDADLEVDEKTTLIVGRNNTAKTSCFECVRSVLEGIPFSFNDYPLSKRENLYSKIFSYMAKEITFDALCKEVEPISVEFLVDYSLDDADDDLGALSPFIIDVDVDTTTALIRAEFKLKEDEKSLFDILEERCYKEETFSPEEDAYTSIVSNFSKLFELTIYAVNPKNVEERQIKKQAELRELFPSYLIPAERLLGEDGSQKSSLSELISEFFDMSEEELEPTIADKVKELRVVVEDASKSVQQQSDEILSALVSSAIGFGYPNGEELQLGVKTQLSIDEQIKHQTQLSYTAGANKESLPSEYNGLGYKNLIKMEFLLAAFAKKVEKWGSACIPMLFIEEPESHMHPQMQHAFAEYLEKFLGKITSVGIQTFITSHSAHIANTMVFSKIRYAQKTNKGVIYKNLNEFAKENPTNTEFIRKYLTLTKCDLFFADKAILVEGASERLLLPDMIQKCAKAGDFNTQKYKLPAQYYTLIEIGGAYAYKFIPFAEFLGIPCLILTDLDSVAGQVGKNGRAYYNSVTVSRGETTSNETIKWWVRKNKGLNEKDKTLIDISEITAMSADAKTMEKCHIEYQTAENGLCGRSLEEAIKNVNRSHYGLSDTATETDLEFDERSKTDFALKLIYECEDYTIPAYIRSGLVWLNNQKVLE
ncbi:MAG: AAA family ATPase [Clostridia bacterium]|nr:AAA family ATPase [Clostridia bacterium]